MNQETANYIMQRMSKYLDNSQMIKLKDTLDESLRQSEDGFLEKSSQELLDMFIATKRLEGRSEKTLFLYRLNIEKMLEKSDKNVCVMNTDDIRGYLSSYQEQNGVGKATVDNVRRNLSSFFKWLEDEERECVVLGKGDKERIVYFDARTKLHLKKYLKTRNDSNPALFVTIRKPHHRLKAGGVEIMLKKMGEDCNVNHVHPHKFRRTMATTAIDKGMPIEQVQHLLGHEKIDTTLHYAMVKQSNVKMVHKKYIG